MPHDKPKGSCGEMGEEVDVDTVVMPLETQLGLGEPRAPGGLRTEVNGREGGCGINYTSRTAPGQESDTGTETC